MTSSFTLTEGAVEDLKEIWNFISARNIYAADKVEAEILDCCEHLARFPLSGSLKENITGLNLRFSPVTKFPSYQIVYRPNTSPIEIMAVLHGKRNLRKVLSQRSSH